MPHSMASVIAVLVVLLLASPLWLGIVVQLLHNRTKRKEQRTVPSTE
jgi:hypothetical protein